MIARFFVAGLVEASDQLLADIAHLAIGNKIRMQVDLTELGEDQIQAVGFVQLSDVLLKTEMVDDVPCPAGEALDVLCQVGGDIIWITFQILD